VSTEPTITDEMARRFQEAHHTCDGEGPGGLALCCVRAGLAAICPLIVAQIRKQLDDEIEELRDEMEKWNAERGFRVSAEYHAGLADAARVMRGDQ